MNQVRALGLIISAQKDLITTARPIINTNCLNNWEKKNKTVEEKTAKPYEEEDNDYKYIINLKDFLEYCRGVIRDAETTKTKEDDFLIERNVNNDNEKRLELTSNFWEMLNELEDTYEKIYMLLTKHRIVSSGDEADEELSYKEQEARFIERFREA